MTVDLATMPLKKSLPEQRVFSAILTRMAPAQISSVLEAHLNDKEISYEKLQVAGKPGLKFTFTVERAEPDDSEDDLDGDTND